MRTKKATANRLIAIIGSMWSWAQKAGHIPETHNPVLGIEKFLEVRRERYLSAEEITRLDKALTIAERDGIPWEPKAGPNAKHAPKNGNRLVRISPHVATAFRLLLLTGARLREILNLKWDYVDLTAGLLKLPDSKTGPKTITLNAHAASLLNALSELGSFGPYVIPGDSLTRPRSDLKRPWAVVTKLAELPNVRIHDLRHTNASFGVSQNLSLPIVGQLLGHTQVRTTQKYAHLGDSPVRQAANLIGDKIGQSMPSIYARTRTAALLSHAPTDDDA